MIGNYYMIPVECEEDVRRLELMLEESSFRGGPCARDLESGKDITSPGYGCCLRDDRESEFVLERYAIGVNGEMKVLRRGEQTPLSFSLVKGVFYDFQI